MRRDFEAWSLIASLVASAMVGFFVAYSQPSVGPNTYLVLAIFFFVLMLVSLGMVYLKLRGIHQSGQSIKYRLIREQLDPFVTQDTQDSAK